MRDVAPGVNSVFNSAVAAYRGTPVTSPFLDKVAYKHTLKEQAVDIAEQICITKDNVQVGVDGVPPAPVQFLARRLVPPLQAVDVAQGDARTVQIGVDGQGPHRATRSSRMAVADVPERSAISRDRAENHRVVLGGRVVRPAIPAGFPQSRRDRRAGHPRRAGRRQSAACLHGPERCRPGDPNAGASDHNR